MSILPCAMRKRDRMLMLHLREKTGMAGRGLFALSALFGQRCREQPTDAGAKAGGSAGRTGKENRQSPLWKIQCNISVKSVDRSPNSDYTRGKESGWGFFPAFLRVYKDRTICAVH